MGAVDVEAGAEEVDVGVTIQEQADEMLAGIPPQLEANVGSAPEADAVYVGQNCDAADDDWMNCLRQLSW